MSEPNARDRQVAHAFNLENAKSDGWPILVLSAYREECERAERERVLTAIESAFPELGRTCKLRVQRIIAKMGQP
jgi:hypothetical protein